MEGFSFIILTLNLIKIENFQIKNKTLYRNIISNDSDIHEDIPEPIKLP